MTQEILQSELALRGANLSEIARVASEALSDFKSKKIRLTAFDASGNSGAKTFICKEGELPRCIVKVSGEDSIMSSHPNTIKRVGAATKVMRDHGIAPPILIKGLDFHVELSAGLSVMKDFFHFDSKLAPPVKIAELLAKIHSAPTSWYKPLRELFLSRDNTIGEMLKQAPKYSPIWCLPWSGYDTGMPVLGVGDPDPATAKKILQLEIETGVFSKLINCSAFNPNSDAARREVVVHNDFKPDNILYNPETKDLTAIDYDLVQVGPAIMEFGLPYTMWLGSRFTSFDFRYAFIKSYLSAARLPKTELEVKEMMLDCEINTIVAFPGLLAKLYDAEVPLLRGIQHPTTKVGFEASGPKVVPTGLELIDLLANIVKKIRSDSELIEQCLKDGLVITLFNNEGLGSKPLNSWLKEMQRNRMLRLFGIAETDGGEIYVSKHAR